MKKKRWLAGILGVVMAIATMAGCSGTSNNDDGNGGNQNNSASPVNLKLSYTTSDTSVWRVVADEFARLVEEETDGRYTISIYANEQLGGGNMEKATEMILDGTVDVDLRSITNYTNYEPKLYVVTMPWIFKNGNDSVDEYIFNGEGGDLIKELVEAKGVKVLGLAENGFRQLTNNKQEVTSPEDLAFMKVRVPAISTWMDTFKTLGADPTAMSFSEVFTALQQGTIDGQENPTDPILSGKVYEVQKYLTRWNYAYDCLIFSMSEKAWGNLSEEDKAIFQDAATKACKAEVEASRAADAGNYEVFEKAGVQITDLTEEQIAVFQDAVKPVYNSYKDQVTE